MMRAALWLLMMLAWLAGLVFGVWWVWPLFERGAVTADLLMALLWLGAGAAAWLLAFDLGRRRYWRR